MVISTVEPNRCGDTTAQPEYCAQKTSPPAPLRNGEGSPVTFSLVPLPAPGRGWGLGSRFRHPLTRSVQGVRLSRKSPIVTFDLFATLQLQRRRSRPGSDLSNEQTNSYCFTQ